jgi:glycosyltransferase involved in cell wall biosynthesis
VGARGLHWRDGEHLIVTDDATAFRSAVALLLEDPDRRAQLASAGRRFVEEELDGVRQISRLLAALVSRPARR